MPQTAPTPVIPSDLSGEAQRAKTEAEGSKNVPSGRNSPTPLRSGQNDNRKNAWSPERRARQSAMMRSKKIWLKSTGPKTKAGKACSSRNAIKSSNASDPDRMMINAARAHGRYLAEIHRFITLKKIAVKNELLKRTLKNMDRTLRRRGRRVTQDLTTALLYVQLCGRLGPAENWESSSLRNHFINRS